VHLVAVALTGAVALPAQPPNMTFVGVSIGVAARPVYYRSQPFGIEGSFTAGQAVSRRVALRLDVEAQRFGVRDTICFNTPEGGCGPPPNSPVVTVAVLASAEWYPRSDHRSFYLLGGLGRQWLVSNPDGPRAVHLVAQLGLGFALGPKRLSMEVRYQRVAGASGNATQAVPITVAIRWP
jgi:hypothetical protein